MPPKTRAGNITSVRCEYIGGMEKEEEGREEKAQQQSMVPWGTKAIEEAGGISKVSSVQVEVEEEEEGEKETSGEEVIKEGRGVVKSVWWCEMVREEEQEMSIINMISGPAFILQMGPVTVGSVQVEVEEEDEGERETMRMSEEMVEKEGRGRAEVIGYSGPVETVSTFVPVVGNREIEDSCRGYRTSGIVSTFVPIVGNRGLEDSGQGFRAFDTIIPIQTVVSNVEHVSTFVPVVGNREIEDSGQGFRTCDTPVHIQTVVPNVEHVATFVLVVGNSELEDEEKGTGPSGQGSYIGQGYKIRVTVIPALTVGVIPKGLMFKMVQ